MSMGSGFGGYTQSNSPGLIEGFLALRDFHNARKFLNSPDFVKFVQEAQATGQINPELARRMGKYPEVRTALEGVFAGPRERATTEQTKAQTARYQGEESRAGTEFRNLGGFSPAGLQAKSGAEETTHRIGLENAARAYLEKAGFGPTPQASNVPIAAKQVGVEEQKANNAAVSDALQTLPNLMMFAGQKGGGGIQDLLTAMTGSAGPIGDILTKVAAAQGARKKEGQDALKALNVGGEKTKTSSSGMPDWIKNLPLSLGLQQPDFSKPIVSGGPNLASNALPADYITSLNTAETAQLNAQTAKLNPQQQQMFDRELMVYRTFHKREPSNSEKLKIITDILSGIDPTKSPFMSPFGRIQ